MTSSEKIELIKRMITYFYEGSHKGEDAYSTILDAIFIVVEFGEGGEQK